MQRRGDEGVIDLEADLIVVLRQQVDVEMNQRFENGKLKALGRVHDGNSARVPAPAVLPGSQSGEGLVDKRLARDPPEQHDAGQMRCERLEGLVKVAVLDAAELIRDERRACIRDKQAERCKSLKCAIGTCEPFASLDIVPESFDCALCDPSHAGNAVTLLRSQHTLLLTALRGALVGIDKAHEGHGGLPKEFAEMLDRGVLEAEPHSAAVSLATTRTVASGRLDDSRAAQQCERGGVNEGLDGISPLRHSG